MEAETFLGRDFPSQVNGTAQAGTLTLTLDNSDDRWSSLNASSPVNSGVMSLRPGRRVQIRDAAVADPQPTLLARDRFLAGDGPLTTDERGNAWATSGTYGLQRVDRQAVGAATYGTGEAHVSVVDTGETDYTVTARLATAGAETSGLTGNVLGVVLRWQDADNYTRYQLDVDAALLSVIEVVAGVETTLDTAGVEVRDGFLLTARVLGTAGVFYVDGVATLSATIGQTDETHVGLYAVWGSSGQPSPALTEFEAWSDLLQPATGILFTGEVERVTTSVGRDRRRVATVRCRGRLGKLVDREVAAPRFNAGQGSGYMVGRILGLAGQLSPQPGTGAIDAGTVALGLITADDVTVDALDAARAFELAERGFLHERTDGAVVFNSASARAIDTRSITPQAWFSDEPGAQLGFEEIEPLDAVRDVVNRVRVAVAGPIPTGAVTAAADQDGAGVANHITRTFAGTPDDGDLYVWVIGSTVQTDDQDWRSPNGYTSHRIMDNGSGLGLRVFSRVMDGTEVSVTFYNDAGSSGGNWRLFEIVYSADEWYGDASGLYVSDVAEGSNPLAIYPPWDGAATDIITVRAGIGSTIGAAVSDTVAPLGYTLMQDDFDQGLGAVQAFDLAMQSARRSDVFGFQDPGPWGGTFSGFNIVETVTIAVRGYNGDPPNRSGAAVHEHDDVPSQDDHGQVLALDAVDAPFATAADAEEYATNILAAYRTERPLVELTYTATRNALCRTTALGHRLNDRVHVDADGDAGLGFAGDFYVESVRHRISNGARLWECTLGLSPA